MSYKTFTEILTEMLARIPDTYDKRDMSPIPTALAPSAYAIEGFYITLNRVQQAAYVQTATGESLDLLSAIAGVSRQQASPAVRAGTFDVTVPLGARFSTINGADSINFSVTSIENGEYQLTAETVGVIGNEYFGNLLPITTIPNLQVAILGDILIPGEDTETDTALRERVISALTDKPFGGNVADYRDNISVIDGVGAVQVYPVWNGGGTVKCSILGADLLPAPPTLVQTVQDTIDPEPNKGLGLGLAPIGADVTIVAPSEVTVNVTATVLLEPGYTLPQVQPIVEQTIEEYLVTIRQNWDIPIGTTNVEYEANVFLSRVLASIVFSQGIVNASNVLINGEALDLILTQSGTVQQIPILGTVVLSE